MRISESYQEFENNEDESYHGPLLTSFDQISGRKPMNCPFPGCKSTCDGAYKLAGHIMDDHKEALSSLLKKETGKTLPRLPGEEFKRLARWATCWVLENPGELKGSSPKKKVTPSALPVAPVKPKKVKPILEQQNLLPEEKKPQEDVQEAIPAVPEEPARVSRGRSAFSQVSEYIRDSDEINKVWRGKVWDEYVDMFHGIPPCFHCRSEEGKQIHHQNPLFHEIILVTLNKLGTTAEMVIEERDQGNNEPLNKLLAEVFAYHMKQGKVCAVPYCQGCNQDAEIKRRRGKARNPAD